MDNQLVWSSLGGQFALCILPCLQFFVSSGLFETCDLSSVHISMSIVVFDQLLFRQLRWGWWDFMNKAPGITRRCNLTEHPLVPWLSWSFHRLFPDVPWYIQAGAVMEINPLRLGSPQSVDLCSVSSYDFLWWSLFSVKRSRFCLFVFVFDEG